MSIDADHKEPNAELKRHYQRSVWNQGFGLEICPFISLEWNQRVEKPLIKILSALLKPIFRWNHEWTMKRGERQIVEYLKNGGGGQIK